MHPYSIDVNDRLKALLIVLVISLPVGWAVSTCLKGVSLYESYSWLVDAPSSLTLVGILYKLVDTYAWKWFAKMKIFMRTPVLDGIYKGNLYSSRDDKKNPTEITLRIKQTLSKIRISLSTSQSTSKSRMAAIFPDEPDGVLLIFEYLNDHRNISDPALTIHTGLTRLIYDKDKESLTGTYFTSPERGYYGDIKAKKT